MCTALLSLVTSGCVSVPEPPAADADVTPSIDAGPSLPPWSTPLQVMTLENGDFSVAAPSIYEDPGTGNFEELYYSSNESGVQDIYVSRWVSGDWAAGTIVENVNDAGFVETSPEISRDGLTLYFASDRAGSLNIYKVTRSPLAGGWSTPIFVQSDGLALSPGTPFADNSKMIGQLDINLRSYVSPDNGDNWSPDGDMTRVAALNTLDSEGAAHVSEDGLVLYFERVDAITSKGDLFVSQRASVGDPFPAPVPMSELNSTDDMVDDLAPWVSDDGKTVYFASDRDTMGQFQIYRSTR
jgi:hypothetical protein